MSVNPSRPQRSSEDSPEREALTAAQGTARDDGAGDSAGSRPTPGTVAAFVQARLADTGKAVTQPLTSGQRKVAGALHPRRADKDRRLDKDRRTDGAKPKQPRNRAQKNNGVYDLALLAALQNPGSTAPAQPDLPTAPAGPRPNPADLAARSRGPAPRRDTGPTRPPAPPRDGSTAPSAAPPQHRATGSPVGQSAPLPTTAASPPSPPSTQPGPSSQPDTPQSDTPPARTPQPEPSAPDTPPDAGAAGPPAPTPNDLAAPRRESPRAASSSDRPKPGPGPRRKPRRSKSADLAALERGIEQVGHAVDRARTTTKDTVTATAKGAAAKSAAGAKGAVKTTSGATSAAAKGAAGAVGAARGTAAKGTAGAKRAVSKDARRAKDPQPKNPRGKTDTKTARAGAPLRETSAGGLVISGWDDPAAPLHALLIGRTDRRGRMMWSMPKGHIESGETTEQTAVREVAEETGINARVVGELGKIDYWFVSEGRRIHKTVHHYLMSAIDGELSTADAEVAAVEWVPVAELAKRLTYSDERRLARVADREIAKYLDDPAALKAVETATLRTEPNAYEKAAAARNERRNEPPRPERRRRRGGRRRGRGGSSGENGDRRNPQRDAPADDLD